MAWNTTAVTLLLSPATGTYTRTDQPHFDASKRPRSLSHESSCVRRNGGAAAEFTKTRAKKRDPLKRNGTRALRL